MTQFRPEVRTLFKLLEDDQWHDYNDISTRLAATIAPGKALRKYEHRLARRRANAISPVTMPEPTEDAKITYGQRLIANQVINGVRKRYLEYDETTRGRQVRLIPGAPIPRTGTPLEPGESAEETTEWEEDPEPEDSEPEDPEEPEEDLVPEQPEEDLGQASAEPARQAISQEDLDRFQSCESCGMLVADETKHRLWHDAVVKEIEEAVAEPGEGSRDETMALFSEEAVRALVAQEVGTQLDAFQAGLQLWLSERLEEFRCPIAALHQSPS